MPSIKSKTIVGPDGKTKKVEIGSKADIKYSGMGFTEAPGAPAPKPEKIYRNTTGNEFGLQDPEEQYYKRLDLKGKSPDQIRQETQARLQPQIDAIEGVYSGLFQQEQQAGLERSGRTRAMVARGGLMGSGRGQGQQNKTLDYNQQLVQNLQARKAQDVAFALGEIDKRATQAIDAEQLRIKGNTEAWLTHQKESREGAIKNLDTLASSGQVELSDLDPRDIEDLMRDSGFTSKGLFENYFNAKKPKETKVKYTYTIRKDGTVVKQGDDGTFEVTDIDVPPEVDSQIFSADNGDLLYVDKNTGEYKSLGNYAKPEKPEGLTPEQQRKADEEKTANIDQQTLAIQSAKDKISMINGLINSKGMAKTVGPSAFGRWTPFTADTWTGETQDFVAGVNQLISKETLDGLLQLKAGGGTLGALSDQERIMLQNAATKIGSYQIKDAKGNPTGKFNASEGSFKKELETIKTLAQRAVERAEKKILTPEEEKELETDFSNFDPAQYY